MCKRYEFSNTTTVTKHPQQRIFSKQTDSNTHALTVEDQFCARVSDVYKPVSFKNVRNHRVASVTMLYYFSHIINVLSFLSPNKTPYLLNTNRK